MRKTSIAANERYNPSILPGDLLHYVPEGSDSILIGVIVTQHDDIFGLENDPFPLDKPGGPGVGIYWQTTNKVAYWPYSEIEFLLGRGAMQVLSKIQKT